MSAVKSFVKLCVVIILGFIVFNIIFNDFDIGYINITPNYTYEIDDNTEFIIDNIETFNQNPQYPTGCESVSLYLLLRHYNIDVSVDDIISVLKKGPVPYGTEEILKGANPENEFVGNPYIDTSYGVFEGPIKDVANHFKSGAIGKKGVNIVELENIIKSSNPVIAWIRTKENYDKVEYGKPWLDYNTGEEIPWIRYEHAVLVYGFNEKSIYISNPYNGLKYDIDREIFSYNFNLMGGRIVYYS